MVDCLLKKLLTVQPAIKNQNAKRNKKGTGYSSDS